MIKNEKDIDVFADIILKMCMASKMLNVINDVKVEVKTFHFSLTKDDDDISFDCPVLTPVEKDRYNDMIIAFVHTFTREGYHLERLVEIEEA